MKGQKVVIIPCSGIGKSLGTVGRVATYKVTDRLRPKKYEDCVLGASNGRRF